MVEDLDYVIALGKYIFLLANNLIYEFLRSEWWDSMSLVVIHLHRLWTVFKSERIVETGTLRSIFPSRANRLRTVEVKLLVQDPYRK